MSRLSSDHQHAVLPQTMKKVHQRMRTPKTIGTFLKTIAVAVAHTGIKKLRRCPHHSNIIHQCLSPSVPKDTKRISHSLLAELLSMPFSR